MNVSTLLDNFDLLADAPNAAAKMRELVLQLAVQGRLVRQDPNDEPALNNSGRNGELSAHGLFEIPEQWSWTQLWQLADINGGFAFKSSDYSDDGTRIVRISDFDEFGFKDHKVVRHPFTPELQKFMLFAGNILIAMTGGTVGKSYYVRSLPEPMVVNQRVATIKVSSQANPSYIDILIRSEITQEVIRDAKNSTNDNISMADIKGFVVPLPPLAEQKRIVAKADELMALCDRLDKQQQERDTRHAALARASLARFADAPTPANLEFLFHKSYNITPADLRKSILTLAVQGKLIPQDPNDEQLDQMLGEIQIAKQNLKLTKSCNQCAPASQVDDEVPFEVPDTWRWLRLSDVTSYIQRGKSPTYAEVEGSLVVSQKCVRWHGLDLGPAKRITQESLETYEEIRFLRDGDLLWNSTGTGTIGRVSIVTNPPDNLICDSHVTVVRCLYIDPRYVRNWLASEYVYGQIEDLASGSTNQIELTAQMAVNQLLPIPPFAEQRRIVAKVDQLMAMVDQLETQLAASRATAANLLEAVVAELSLGYSWV
jgi:type I restriction enzyme S subunit